MTTSDAGDGSAGRTLIPVQEGISAPGPDVDTMYKRVGGQAFFDALVERFYARVEVGNLRPMYPDDLGPSKRHLALFLAQYWGGPTTYSDERGHPRLRMRHAPFPIGVTERNLWVEAMSAAVDESDLTDTDKAEMLEYYEKAATFLINGDR